MDICFKQLNLGLSPNNPLFEDCKRFDYDHVDVARREGKNGRTDQDVPVSSTFKQHRVSLDYFKDEPILEVIQAFNLMPKILMIQPNHIYNWHRDSYRATAFNLMLSNDDNYLVMFCYDKEKNQVPPKGSVYFPYVKLEYQPNKFYLLNTQVPHNSINYGTEPRYVLSMGYYELDPLDTEKIGFYYYRNALAQLKDRNLL